MRMCWLRTACFSPSNNLHPWSEQVAGGVWADRFGGKRVLGAGVVSRWAGNGWMHAMDWSRGLTLLVICLAAL